MWGAWISVKGCTQAQRDLVFFWKNIKIDSPWAPGFTLTWVVGAWRMSMACQVAPGHGMYLWLAGRGLWLAPVSIQPQAYMRLQRLWRTLPGTWLNQGY